VAAPVSTIDVEAADGSRVEIEERSPAEVTTFAPVGTPARNPAFDVTPAGLVSAIVTDRGVVEPPYPVSIAGLMAAAA
jgi:methylthioribose-1-phosphate isomerase